MTDPRGSPAPLLGALWLLTFAQTCQFMLVVPILPDISRELRFDPELGGTLIASYGITAALFSLISGPISDKVGRRRVLVVGTLMMALGLLLHPLAHSFGALLFMRALTGVASGVLSGAVGAYVGDYFPYERRGWANGIIMSGLAAGQVAGIPLGTLLAKSMGFSAPFLAFGVLLLVNTALIALYVPQAAVALESELTVSSALKKYGYLLSHTQPLAATAAFVLMFTGVSAFVSYLPTWLEEAHGASPNDVALMYFCGGLAALVGNPVAGRLSDRIGRKGIIIAASLALAVLQALTPVAMVRLEVAYGLFFLTMIAASMRMAPLQSLLTAIVGPAQRGTLLGMASAAGSFGFAMGGAASGFLYTRHGFAACAAVAVTAVLASTGVIAAFLPEPQRGA